MAKTVKLQWIISPVHLPQPWFECAGCSTPASFHSTGKARLNANGRRLDAWLIYQCNTCGGTRNLPIFERRQIEAIEASVLAALQQNEAHWCAAWASDVAWLKRYSNRVNLSKEYILEQRQDTPLCAETEQVEIAVTCTGPVQLRLDRLLAEQLGLSRTTVTRWYRRGVLTCSQSSMSKSLKNTAKIWLPAACLSEMSLKLARRLEPAD